MRPFHFINVTWGTRHTQLFLEVSLPTQLAPHNLPALSSRDGAVYKIYTTPADADVIRRSPIFQRLCQTLPTEIIHVEVNPQTPHHLMFAEFHKLAIGAAEKVEAALVFLAPDMLYSDGCFAQLCELADAGKRAVFTVGIRLSKETFVPAFHERFRANGQCPVSMTGRELVDLALDHLHPLLKAMTWPAHVCWPSNLLWPVGQEGVIARCFHLHPLLIVASPHQASFSSTIDDDYLDQCCQHEKDTYVVCDSDEMSTFEISPEDYTMGLIRADPMDHQGVARWALLNANRVHRQLFASSIRVHRGGCTNAWEKVQAESDEDVRKVFRLLRIYVWCFYLSGGNIVYPFLRRVLRPYKSSIKRLLSIPVWIGKAILGLLVENPRQFAANCVHQMQRWGDRFKRLMTQPRQTLSRLALKIRGRSNRLPLRAAPETASVAMESARLGSRMGLVETSETIRFDSNESPVPSRDARAPAGTRK